MNLQQYILNSIKSMPANNPMANNLMAIIKNNDMQALQNMGQNVLKTNNLTYEQAQKQILNRVFNK